MVLSSQTTKNEHKHLRFLCRHTSSIDWIWYLLQYRERCKGLGDKRRRNSFALEDYQKLCWCHEKIKACDVFHRNLLTAHLQGRWNLLGLIRHNSETDTVDKLHRAREITTCRPPCFCSAVSLWSGKPADLTEHAVLADAATIRRICLMISDWVLASVCALKSKEQHKQNKTQSFSLEAPGLGERGFCVFYAVNNTERCSNKSWSGFLTLYANPPLNYLLLTKTAAPPGTLQKG